MILKQLKTFVGPLFRGFGFWDPDVCGPRFWSFGFWRSGYWVPSFWGLGFRGPVSGPGS